MAPTRKPEEAIKEAESAINESLRRQDRTGLSEVEQVFAQAEAEGNPIAGDPATTRMDEVPAQYRRDTPMLSAEWLAEHGMDPSTIVTIARQGLLGEAYRTAPKDALMLRAQEAARSVKRQADIDAGPHVSRTLVDPHWELYWTGKAPHPKHPDRWVVMHSKFPEHTRTYGINGRLWHCVKGVRVNVPSEVILIMIDEAVALARWGQVNEHLQALSNMTIAQKVAAQGGDSMRDYAEHIRSQIPEHLSAENIANSGSRGGRTVEEVLGALR